MAAASGGFKLSGSFKPAAPPKDDRFQYNVNAAAVVRPEAAQPARGAGPAGSGDMPLPPPSEPPPPPGGDAAAQQGAAPPAAAAQGAAAAEDEGEEPDIPDEEMIAWAKAKRERLRGAHLAPDYIPTAAAPPGLSRCAAQRAGRLVAAHAWACGAGRRGGVPWPLAGMCALHLGLACCFACPAAVALGSAGQPICYSLYTLKRLCLPAPRARPPLK